jgi:hypothetical protein
MRAYDAASPERRQMRVMQNELEDNKKALMNKSAHP